MTIEAFAPGRVNLIGEHVDYVGGLVLPCALRLGIRIAAEPVDAPEIRLASAGHGEVVVRLDGGGEPEGWARYVAAVAAELAEAGVALRGVRGTLASDLPVGAGLSSSAALEMAVALVLLEAADARGAVEGIDLAELGRRAETRAVGLPCGVMDQAASLLADEGCALLLDCGSLVHRAVRVPADLALVVVDSGVSHRLEDSGYATRRAEAEEALDALPPDAARDPDVEGVLAGARAAGVAPVPLRRLRHLVTEHARVERFAAELERPDGPDHAVLARLLLEGHASLRDDYEVSVPEVDRLVEIAVDEGAVGARMTGGGFGGAIVALAPAADAPALADRIADRYAAETGLPALRLTSRPGPGASASRRR